MPGNSHRKGRGVLADMCIDGVQIEAVQLADPHRQAW